MLGTVTYGNRVTPQIVYNYVCIYIYIYNTNIWASSLVAMQYLHSLNAEQISLKSPKARFARLSAHKVP